MKKFGFTLAEVLITLGIIGVVAAMTIPTLITNSNNQANAVALAKFYSTFNAALKQLGVDNNCPDDLKCTGLFTGSNVVLTAKMGDELVGYIKTVKNCRVNGAERCAPDSIKYLNKVGSPAYDFSTYYRIITTDGMSVVFKSISTGNCDYSSGSPLGDGALKEVCGDLFVDVNGSKPPNQIGRDNFRFFITSNGGLIPFGVHSFTDSNKYWDGSNNVQKCEIINGVDIEGWGCAGRILEEGWKMNY